MATEHLSGYQARDFEIVDYQMYEDPDSGLFFRGPRPDLQEGGYISCIGAAQIFGCFCQKTIPDHLSEALGMPVLNLGYGGAGPAFFARQKALISTINRGKLVVIQVMSGRSESNELYESGGLEYLTCRRTGQKISANAAYDSLLRDNPPWIGGLPGKLIRTFYAPRPVRDLLAQTRQNWLQSSRELLEQITVPSVLLWISKRPPGLYRSNRAKWWWQRYDGTQVMFGDFPQLVNASMVKTVRGMTTGYAQAVTERGSPQPLYSRFSGERVSVDMSLDRPDFPELFTHNTYYPSPEMLEDAAQQLAPVCKRYLTDG